MHSEKIKNRIYLNLFVILVIFGIWYLFISPQYSGSGNFYSPTKNIKTLLQTKKDMSGAVTIVKKYDQQLGQANGRYVDALNTLPIAELDKILPTTVDPVVIVYELTKIAALPESGLLLSAPKVSINDPSDKVKYGTLSVSFATQGSYEAIKTFLQNLENSKRIYNVTSLSFTAPQDSTVSQLYKYSITVETYYLNSMNKKN